MTGHRIHRTTSDDGTGIAGTVQGQGPPLVLLHGGLEDGDFCWREMLPFLEDQFTCYLMNRRDRGLSDPSTDLSPERLLEDTIAFLDSISEPVSVIGESDGAALALAGAARSDAVSAVAVYEPTVFDVVTDDVAARIENALPRISQTVDEGRLSDAAREFAEVVANDDELATLSAMDYWKDAGRFIATELQEMEQSIEHDGPSPTDAALLGKITAPVLVLSGSRTRLHTWFTAGVRHITDHVANAQSREIAGAGHFGVALEPETIANEMVAFLTRPAKYTDS
ncbi:MAG TPA: alpha/beta hydrolase [Jiangellaceae bacterium]